MATSSNKSNSIKFQSSRAYQDGPNSAFSKKVAESSIKQSVDSKQKSVIKTEVKGKIVAASSSKSVSKAPQKRVKKVYSISGQKYDPPEEREPLRIFYESLSKQIPSSEMAEFWMMEHGLLSPDRAKRAFEKKQRKQKQQRIGTPIKTPPPYIPIKSETMRKQQQVPKNGELKAKKRILANSDDEYDDFKRILANSDDEYDDFVLTHTRRKV